MISAVYRLLCSSIDEQHCSLFCVVKFVRCSVVIIILDKVFTNYTHAHQLQVFKTIIQHNKQKNTKYSQLHNYQISRAQWLSLNSQGESLSSVLDFQSVCQFLVWNDDHQIGGSQTRSYKVQQCS